MRILGVDPGLRQTGYGLLDVSARGPGLLEAGVIHTNDRSSLPGRLRELYSGFTDLISDGRPELIAVEDLFAHPRFPRTAIVMGQVWGVIQLAAAQAGIPIEAIPPASVKRAMVASGQAGKRQVQRMVRRLLAMAEDPGAHVADALALALTAVSRRGFPLGRPAHMKRLA
jgi:crossover junction endodeoxyribonuclease RuvC